MILQRLPFDALARRCACHKGPVIHTALIHYSTTLPQTLEHFHSTGIAKYPAGRDLGDILLLPVSAPRERRLGSGGLVTEWFRLADVAAVVVCDGGVLKLGIYWCALLYC